MEKIEQRIQDKRVLKLIRKFLQAGIMIGGLFHKSKEGTPQGGPLSPLFSNIVLDDLDKPLHLLNTTFGSMDFALFGKLIHPMISSLVCKFVLLGTEVCRLLPSDSMSPWTPLH